MIQFSIITPVFNREDCISRCINSVIRQQDCTGFGTEYSYEHIIVDDGSTDKTSLICEKYSSKYQEIKHIVLPKNRGTNAARNIAIQSSVGNYIIILDSDDFFVENALYIIALTIKSHKDFSYFLFVPNDKIPFFNNNPYFKCCNEKVLSFSDFLSEKISTDYVHVCKSNIMKIFPFDESLRIYEGVFFLRFYKYAGKIFFKKEIITIRERSRQDSVTRFVFRINRDAIKRSINSTSLYIEWFENDYIEFNCHKVLATKLNSLFKNNVLLCNNIEANKYLNKLQEYNFKVNKKYLILYTLHLGWIQRLIIKFGLYIKYTILNKKLK